MKTQLEYFLKNFNLFYDSTEVDIDYSKVNDGKLITIHKSAEDLFWNKQDDIELEKIIWKMWKGVKIPFLFDTDDKEDIISFTDNKAIINYDIVASAFYFLSGWNEIVNKDKDEFGRVRYQDSIIYKLKISNIPVVNYYFDILNEAITKVHHNIQKTLWGDSEYSMCITHDIDNCTSAWLEGSFSELKKKKLFSIPKLIFKRIAGKDDWFNFDTIAQIESKYGVSSSFFFLPRKGKSGNWKNADYDIESNSIKKVIIQLQEAGKDIGVHGSFGTHANIEKLKNDIVRVGTKQVYGNRFHFLMFDPLKSVSVLEQCGLNYDTTLGFAEQTGFRRSTCYPFYLFNHEKNQASDVLEIPLIVMDTTLSRYMKLNAEKAVDNIRLLIQETAKFKGVFTLLWHNTSFSDYKYTGWREVYIKILDLCENSNGLMTSGYNIYKKIIR